MSGGEGYVPFNDLPWSSHRLLVEYAGRDGAILEIGCSTGYVTERLVRNGNRVTGLEFDERDAAVAAGVCEDVVVGDVETMDLPAHPGGWDAITAGDVLEHLRDPQALLGRLAPLLRPGGRLVVSTPNFVTWWVRVMILFGRFRYADRGILDRTHTHFFTRATLVEAVERAGLRVVEVDASVASPIRPVPLRWAFHRTARVFTGLLAHQLVVVAERP